jgi:hypothetical protein
MPSQTYPKNTGANVAVRLRIDGFSISSNSNDLQRLSQFANVRLRPQYPNFPPKQIGKFMSEVLVLGFPDGEGEVVLVVPDKPVPNGGKLF